MLFDFDAYSYGYTATDFIHPVKEDDYGLEWPKGTTQLNRELYGYWKGGIGGRSKFQHCVNAIRLQWPQDGKFYFEFVSRGIINTACLRVLKACCEYPDLAIAGSASAGKTFPVAAWVLIDWQCAPNQTLSFVCTTSVAASEDRIWGAICKLHRDAILEVGKLIDYKKCIVWGGIKEESAADREYTNAIKAIAIEDGLEGKKAVATTRGRKNKRVRLTFDELPEMGAYVTDARVNLASNIDFECKGIGNPNRKDDAHGEMSRPVGGWDTVNKDTPEWETRTGHCIFLSGEWSPNFQVAEGEPEPFPYLTSRRSLAKMLVLCYGRADSLEYHRNAIGFWISDEALFTIISKSLIKAYEANEPTKWLGTTRKRVCGLDTGFTIGGDLCVATFADLGEETNGRKVFNYHKESIYTAKEGEIFEESIAKQWVDDCIKEGVTPDCAGLDISNDGGKIAQAAIAYWSERLEATGENHRDAFLLVAISSQGKPTMRIVSDVDRRTCQQAYDRRVTENWFSVRQGVLCGVIKNLDIESKVVSELCTRQYEKRAEKILAETKDKMKTRIKVSPDRGDSFTYALEMARRHGLEFIAMEAHKVLQEERRRIQMRRGKTPEPINEGTYGSDSWGDELVEARNSR